MFVINNELWRVKFVNPHNPVLLMPNGNFAIGACDDFTKTISISKAINGKKLKEVLGHEIAHAAMFSYNVNLSLEQEEIVANLISVYGEEIIQITNFLFKNLQRKGRL